MSREIKFRAWDKKHKKMIDWDKLKSIYNLRLFECDRLELMQFTGLHDKNGKEICEGDIIHYVYKPGEGFWNQDCIGIIKWNTTGFKIEPLPGKGGLCTWLISIPGAMEPSCRKLFEIIGNIYEN